ncbi:MAG: ABC transporter permease, partial [Bacillus sp. (in: firmicutes)]
RTTLAVIGGSIIYRIVVTLALRVDFLDTGDMKLITALIVILALTTPKIIESSKERKRKARRRSEKSNIMQTSGHAKGDNHVTIKSDS